MARTVAHVLVDSLAELGARQVFGVVGDALNPITDAIRRADSVEGIGCRHEEAAAFAAGAQSQLTGRLGVCMGTVGPGSVHLLNGLYDAAKSHAPVLAITGQVSLAEARRSCVARGTSAGPTTVTGLCGAAEEVRLSPARRRWGGRVGGPGAERTSHEATRVEELGPRGARAEEDGFDEQCGQGRLSCILTKAGHGSSSCGPPSARSPRFDSGVAHGSGPARQW